MRNKLNSRVCALVLCSLIVSGCTSIKVPDLDFVKFPEFKEEAENIGDYPSVADAPETPTDVRSDKKWDEDAKNLIARRDGFGPVPEGEPMETDAEFNRKVDELIARVEEYKLDDPQ